MKKGQDALQSMDPGQFGVLGPGKSKMLDMRGQVSVRVRKSCSTKVCKRLKMEGLASGLDYLRHSKSRITGGNEGRGSGCEKGGSNVEIFRVGKE